VTVSIRKFRIIVLVSNRIEYWSNYSNRFKVSNIRAALHTNPHTSIGRIGVISRAVTLIDFVSSPLADPSFTRITLLTTARRSRLAWNASYAFGPRPSRLTEPQTHQMIDWYLLSEKPSSYSLGKAGPTHLKLLRKILGVRLCILGKIRGNWFSKALIAN